MLTEDGMNVKALNVVRSVRQVGLELLPVYGIRVFVAVPDVLGLVSVVLGQLLKESRMKLHSQRSVFEDPLTCLLLSSVL